MSIDSAGIDDLNLRQQGNSAMTMSPQQQSEFAAVGAAVARAAAAGSISAAALEGLERSGVDLNATTRAGKTAVYCAAENGHDKTVNWLADQRAERLELADRGRVQLDRGLADLPRRGRGLEGQAHGHDGATSVRPWVLFPWIG